MRARLACPECGGKKAHQSNCSSAMVLVETACPECGGKRDHQRNCPRNTYVAPTLEEQVKEAAEALTASYYFWLGLIEREYELKKAGEWEENPPGSRYSFMGEVRHRAGKDPEKNARRILSPPQM